MATLRLIGGMGGGHCCLGDFYGALAFYQWALGRLEGEFEAVGHSRREFETPLHTLLIDLPASLTTLVIGGFSTTDHADVVTSFGQIGRAHV